MEMKISIPAISVSDISKDFYAGLTVAAISLPQSMAYALIAGVDPRFGLYTAIIFTAISAIFGSSKHLVNGPTGAVSLVVFGALAFIDPDAKLDAYEALFLLTVMIGIVQISVAVLKLGDLTRYISESVVTGFIVGAAILTMVGQVANALGLKALGTGEQHVFYRLWLTVTQAAPLNLKAVTISVSAIVLALIGRKIVRLFKLPQIDMFAVLVLVSAVAYFLGWTDAVPGAKPALGVIEAVPSSLPSFHIPIVKWEWMQHLTTSAFSIAMLGLLEALSIAKAIAHKSGQSLDYNRQCLAEGLGNLVSGFFRCMPGAGSLSRTAINYQAGAVSRFSGLFTAGGVAIAVLIFAPLTAFIPKAALAGLLMVAAARLIDPERLLYTIRGSVNDAFLLLGTTFAALAIGVEFAILIGVVLSVLWYVPRASRLQISELVVTPERVVRQRLESDPPSQGVLIYDLEGELFFGAAPDVERYLEDVLTTAKASAVRYVVLRLKRVRNPDVVALEQVELFLKDAAAQGVTVFLAGVRKDLYAAIHRVGITAHFPEEFIFAEEEQDFSATLRAIRHAYAQLAKDRSKIDASVSNLPDGIINLAYYLV